MMNVLYDHQIFAMQRFGGVSRYFYELISRLRTRDDIALSLFLGAHINEYGLEQFHSSYRRSWGWKHRPMPTASPLFSIFNRAIFRSFFTPEEQEIYHQTYYSIHHATARCKRVVTVYDMIHERRPTDFPSRDRTIAAKKESVTRADAIICISQSTKSDLLRYYHLPEDRIRVIYLANSLTCAVVSPRAVQVPYILYVGLRGGYKNFSLLASAFASSERLRRNYTLICFGGGDFTSKERTQFHSLGIAGSVDHYSGPDELLANLYAYASVFVYPSLFEGFGIPPLEAMHFGCPVLASNTSSIPEVVGDGGLYFDPTAPDDLRQKLEDLLGNDSLRDELRSRGRAQERKFSWDVCAQETAELYRTIAP
ncbi:MAG: glycosyltransferase family 4 protein [Nitrospirota bacterium]